MVRYNTILDKHESEMDPKWLFRIIYVYHSRYNTVWIVNTDTGLYPNNRWYEEVVVYNLRFCLSDIKQNVILHRQQKAD